MSRNANRFQGTVWRHIPCGGHPLDWGFILKARGRWNRPGLYGALYTALTPRGALLEYVKRVRKTPVYQQSPRALVSINLKISPIVNLTMSSQRRAFGIQKKMMRKDSGSAYERCRQVADYARSQGYLGLKVCSAVHKNEINLVIFPEDKPGQIDIQTGEDDERQRITPELVKELTGVNI